MTMTDQLTALLKRLDQVVRPTGSGDPSKPCKLNDKGHCTEHDSPEATPHDKAVIAYTKVRLFRLNDMEDEANYLRSIGELELAGRVDAQVQESSEDLQHVLTTWFEATGEELAPNPNAN